MYFQITSKDVRKAFRGRGLYVFHKEKMYRKSHKRIEPFGFSKFCNYARNMFCGKISREILWNAYSDEIAFLGNKLMLNGSVEHGV